MSRPKSDLLHGTLDLLVLQVVSDGALHGYAIGQRLEQMTDNALKIEQGSLYPALYRLERNGWLKAAWRKTDTGRRAKFYQLTREGRQRLRQELENWTTFTAAVSRVVSGS